MQRINHKRLLLGGLAAGFAGLVTPRLALIPVAWGLVEAPLGTLVGAWLYRE